MTMLIQCLDWTLVLHSDSLYMDLNSSRSNYQPPSSWITSARHYTQLIAHTKTHTFIPTKLLRESFFYSHISSATFISVGGVKISIVAFQAIDPGSIPG